MHEYSPNRPLLSVIIPYHNTEHRYLKRAVDSIRCQDRDLVEIIIIDDGSDEEKALELDQTYKNSQNVKIIHKEWGGVSSARNCGIRRACGDYVAFLDDDDEFTSEFTIAALRYCKEGRYDVVIGGFAYKPDSVKKSDVLDDHEFNEDEREELYKSLIDINPRKFRFRIIGSSCGSIFRKVLIEKLFFDEEVSLSEDQLFLRRLFLNTDIVFTTKEIWYYYYQRASSAMHPPNRLTLYANSIPYLKALHNLADITSTELALMFYTEVFRFVDQFAHDLILEGHEPWKKKKKLLRDYCNNAQIQDSIRVLSGNTKYLNIKKQILLRILKIKQYGLYLLIKKIVAGNT